MFLFTIFFGGFNTGKSFFAYQLAESIASGKQFFDPIDSDLMVSAESEFYKLVNETEAQKVIYLDFEGSKEDLRCRYSNEVTHEYYPFSKNIIPLYPCFSTLAEKFEYIKELKKKIVDTGSKFLIIDNLSAICDDVSDSRLASKIMLQLKDFKRDHKLTILILAHLTKGDEIRETTPAQMQGSYMISAFADSMFSISNTNSSDIRYLKQHKTRRSEKHFQKDNVIVIKYAETLNNFKGFSFVGYENEFPLIKQIDEKDKDAEKLAIIEKLKANKQPKEIAEELHPHFGNGRSLDTYRSTVRQIILRIKRKGLIK